MGTGVLPVHPIDGPAKNEREKNDPARANAAAKRERCPRDVDRVFNPCPQELEKKLVSFFAAKPLAKKRLGAGNHQRSDDDGKPEFESGCDLARPTL
jgi:hypothetical protein